MMKNFEESASFDKFIAENTLVLAYFSGEKCSVCQATKPKIEAMVASDFPEIILVEISTESNPELAARLSVFTIPVILFYVEGREYIREVRIIDISILKQKLGMLLELYR
jgi:thioredoxin-like negative regulator of GroEL